MSASEISFAQPQDLESFLVSVYDVHVGERLRKDYQGIDDLVKSLATYGQIHAITVRPATPEDACIENWVLVTGGRRYAASLKLGWKKIRAENLLHLSPWKRTAIELEENLQRAAMTWQEEVDSKARIATLYKAENPGWSDSQTADILKIDKGQLSRDLKLAKAIEQHPELAKASSKKAAHKLLETKQSLAASVARANTVDMNRIEGTVVHADAFDFLDRFEDNSVDLFLSDLPFGIDYFDRPASDREAGGGVSKFDDSLATAASLVRRILEKMVAKVKPEGWICLMISEDLRWALNNEITIINTQKKVPGKKLSTPAQPWIWYRPNSRNNPIHGHLHAKSMYDIMIPINPGKAVLRKPCENVVVIDSFYGDRVHAHQKPLELGEELISRFTLPGDLVIDVTMGSGAFVAAAAKTNRRFAGCDLNPDIVPLAQGLVAQYFGNTKVADSTPNKGPYMNATPISQDDDLYAADPLLEAAMEEELLEEEFEEELDEDEDPNEEVDDDEDPNLGAEELYDDDFYEDDE